MEARLQYVGEADAGLVLRCRSNDAEAFDEIVRRYQDCVYRYIVRMTGPGPDAEDLAQETFVRAFGAIGSFEGRASLRTWLLRIATNKCIDHRRRSRKPTTTPTHLSDLAAPDGTPLDIPDTAPGPSDLLERDELGGIIGAAVDHLPDKLRAVLILFDVEGLAYEEIAQVLQVPVGTVKSRLFHARESLRLALRPYLMGQETPPSTNGRGARR